MNPENGKSGRRWFADAHNRGFISSNLARRRTIWRWRGGDNCGNSATPARCGADVANPGILWPGHWISQRPTTTSRVRILIRKTLSVTALAALLLSVSTAAYAQCGGASWYGPGFTGKASASGEIFNENAMTAAHRSLPFGTKVKVVDQRSGREIEVTINDRGPFVGKRIIDLSKAAATKLGFRNRGVTSVCISAL
ncbi:MAG: septal ring lytic transglycosylase RlpA family protein [Devosia sp.]